MKPVVEALLFAADEPLSAKQLRVLVEGEKKPSRKKRGEPAAVAEATSVDLPADETPTDEPEPAVPAEEPEQLGTAPDAPEVEEEDAKGGLDARTVRAVVDALNAEYDAAQRSFRIVEIAGGFQFATRKEYGLYVGRLAKDKSRRRLSQAGLETLAIIAYRQPISKPDIEAIRGVNCDEVLSSLLERNLATIVGRADTVGRPLLYGTTEDFLKYFGLVTLKDLPRPREIDELLEAAGVLPDQPMLEVSDTESVAQIEQHLAPTYTPSPEPAAGGASEAPDAAILAAEEVVDDAESTTAEHVETEELEEEEPEEIDEIDLIEEDEENPESEEE